MELLKNIKNKFEKFRNQVRNEYSGYIDDAFLDLGYKKTFENSNRVQYEKYDSDCDSTHYIVIIRAFSDKINIQSYWDLIQVDCTGVMPMCSLTLYEADLVKEKALLKGWT